MSQQNTLVLNKSWNSSIFLVFLISFIFFLYVLVFFLCNFFIHIFVFSSCFCLQNKNDKKSRENSRETPKRGAKASPGLKHKGNERKISFVLFHFGVFCNPICKPLRSCKPACLHASCWRTIKNSFHTTLKGNRATGTWERKENQWKMCLRVWSIFAAFKHTWKMVRQPPGRNYMCGMLNYVRHHHFSPEQTLVLSASCSTPHLYGLYETQSANNKWNFKEKKKKLSTLFEASFKGIKESTPCFSCKGNCKRFNEPTFRTQLQNSRLK